jgi:hypothetical protein
MDYKQLELIQLAKKFKVHNDWIHSLAYMGDANILGII